MPHSTDGSTVVRLARKQIARPKEAFDALLGSRNLNFLMGSDGRIGIDRRVTDLVGSEALAQLLFAHIHAINRYGAAVSQTTTPVSDREVVEAALWALTAVLEEAARQVTDDPKGETVG